MDDFEEEDFFEDQENYYDPNLEKQLQQDFRKDYLEEKLVISCYKLIQIVKNNVPNILVQNQLRIIQNRTKMFQKVCKLKD